MKFNFFLALCLVFVCGTSNAGEEKRKPPVTCSSQQQKVYVAYEYLKDGSLGFASAYICLDKGDETTEEGIEKMHSLIKSKYKQGVVEVVVTNVLKLDR